MPATIAAKGFCKRCDRHHHLPRGNSKIHATNLMEELTKHQRIDLSVPSSATKKDFSTATLFGEPRGKMFGVLECIDLNGQSVVIKAFSGQYNGLWFVDGWAPPLFSISEFNKTNYDTEKEIKRLTTEIMQTDKSEKEFLAKLTKTRKVLSQTLMHELHSLYSLSNFNGETKTLFDAFIKPTGIPTGVGDCCAPKLLNHAAKNNLRPIGLTEFFWGKENKSHTKVHGKFYMACEEKCEPILGFMLCGLAK